MQKCRETRLAGALAIAVLCSGATIVQSQEIRPGLAANPGYSAAVGVGIARGPGQMQTASSPLVSARTFHAEEPPADWENWKADVDARLKKIADKEAAAKKSAAGKPSVKVGGRIFADWYAYDQDANSFTQILNQKNGFRFDTVRMFVSGSAFHVMDYKVQFDFAGTQKATTGSAPVGAGAHTHSGGTLQSAAFKDVFIAVKELPLLGHVKVGHFKEPFSLDQLTSSRHITFLERSLIDTPFVPARNVGIMAYDHSASENMTWAIGAFISEIGDEPPIFKDDSGGTALTTRYTYLPWYDEATEGRGLLHLGAAYSYREIADGTFRLSSKPEAGLGSDIVDTGSGNLTDVSDVQLLGLEAAFVYGPFRIQSEYIASFVDQGAGSVDHEFDGVYVQTTYFLTGEQRKYSRSSGTFSDRVKPFENFFRVRDGEGSVQTGKGAWELAYRCSYVDLNNGAVAGGNATNHTFGLNWYLNPYSRLMFNYINSDLRRGGLTGNMNIFATRFQIDF